MSYPLYIFFGVLPSIIWLLFYLRKDAHPESNRMILKIFFYGMLAAVPAVFLELGIFWGFGKLTIAPFLITILNVFIGVAVIEEVLKYLIVKKKVLNNPEFDEPLDAMLYMIIAALGFAASENILILLPLGSTFLFTEVFPISVLRFLGATFLHTLCSGVLGFFLALSFYYTKKRTGFLLFGLGTAIFLHGLYNLSITNPDLIYRPFGVIIEIESNLKFLIPILILIGSAIFVTFGFKRLKKIKSICKLK